MAEDDARPPVLVLLLVRSCLLLCLLCGCVLSGCVVGDGQPDDQSAAGGEQGNRGALSWAWCGGAVGGDGRRPPTGSLP